MGVLKSIVRTVRHGRAEHRPERNSVLAERLDGSYISASYEGGETLVHVLKDEGSRMFVSVYIPEKARWGRPIWMRPGVWGDEHPDD